MLETLLKSNRLAEAAALLDRDGFVLFEREGPEQIAHVLHALGVTPETSSPRVLALKGLLESNAGRADTAEAWFRLALSRADDKHIKADVTHRFALDLLRQERFGALDLLLPLANDNSLDVSLRASINATIATVHARNGAPNANHALPFLHVALNLLKTLDDEALTARIHQQAAYVFLECEKLEDALQYGESGALLAERHHLYDVLSRVNTVLCSVAAEHDDSEKMVACLEQIQMCAEKTHNRSMQLYALINMCEIQTQRGDVDALVGLDRGLSSLEVRYDDDTVTTLLPSQALRSAWHGDFTHAYRLLASTIPRQPTADRQAIRAAEIAVYAAASLDKSALFAVDEALEKIAAVTDINFRMHRCQCLAALACTIAGDLKRARNLLQSIGDSTERIEAFKAAIAAIVDRFSGFQNHDTLDAAFSKLRAYGYGGYVRLLEALPIASAMQNRFSRLNESDIGALKALLAGANLTHAQELQLCEKLECSETPNVLTLAMRYSPYPVPEAVR